MVVAVVCARSEGLKATKELKARRETSNRWGENRTAQHPAAHLSEQTRGVGTQ